MIPVQLTAPEPQGYEVAVAPLQSQPTNAVEDIVGNIVGENNVGDADEDAMGEGVGALVGGLDGQLLMPCLNVQRALASDY